MLQISLGSFFAYFNMLKACSTLSYHLGRSSSYIWDHYSWDLLYCYCWIEANFQCETSGLCLYALSVSLGCLVEACLQLCPVFAFSNTFKNICKELTRVIKNKTQLLCNISTSNLNVNSDIYWPSVWCWVICIFGRKY